MFNRSCHFSVSPSLLSIYVVHKLSLSLITLINCFPKFFKMIVLSPFWNGIKTGNHWTLKNLFYKLFNNILDGQCSSIGSFCPSTYSVILLQQSLNFILLVFVSKKTFKLIFMRLCKCKYICVLVCIYVVMFVLPTSQNLLCGYFNDENSSLYTKKVFI